MPTPKDGYRLKDGSRVPGTTTIIGRWKDSGALLQWAFKQGKEGKRTLYEDRDKAADIGTCAHGMVELRINEKSHEEIDDYVRATLPDAAMAAQAWVAFGAYEQWARHSQLRIIEQEMQLVSEAYRYGGTPDGIGIIGNELCLIDFKTSNGVYRDYLIQLAAYNNLWIENNPTRPLTGGFHILRFAKTHGDFAHHFYPNLDEAWESFKLMRRLYDLDQQLKKRAA